MKTPKASFVIAAYNAEKYLAETMDSCLRQGLKNIEVVVVNDGSTDGTSELIRYFSEKDERVRGFDVGENRGRSAARNVGIEGTKSDIIMILDADDIALPQRANITCQHFKKNADDIVYGQFVRIDALGNTLDGYDAKLFDIDEVKKTGFTYICHSTMAFRKSVFEKVKYTSGDICKHGIDDWAFQVDAHKAGFKFGAIKKPLVQYRFIEKKRDEQKIAELKAICLSGN